MRKKYPFRSLTETAGWLKKQCERCGGDFWVIPSQSKLRFCANDCRHEAPLIRLLKNATTNEQGCVIFAGAKNDDGYGNIKWNGEQWRSNRLSWRLQVGPIPDGLDVLHTCIDCRACIKIEHLYLGTSGDNAGDRLRQGRQHDTRGEKSAVAKLNNEKVQYIRENPNGLMGKELAVEFGVQPPAISRARLKRSWKHI